MMASESRSTGSDATVIRMRIKKSHAPHSRKPSFYTTYSSKVMPISHYSAHSSYSESVIINIIHDDGGAKAPSLVYEAMAGGP